LPYYVDKLRLLCSTPEVLLPLVVVDLAEWSRCGAAVTAEEPTFNYLNIKRGLLSYLFVLN
jgi:hypothetical protein